MGKPWWEREEEDLYKQYESGQLTLKEYNEAIRELNREYSAAAHEAAENAYQSEVERW